MTIEKLLENFANATGIVVDRTFDPPRILGQAFLVSKSRVVTCAGCVFNYSEAPWALAINFPNPDLVLGVKTISLHPDFDRQEARTNYLSQTAISGLSYHVQLNDLATMVLQTDLSELVPEHVLQLHRALTIPFSSENVEASGPLKDYQLIDTLKTILQAKKQGLLTLFDEVNIPIAYIQLNDGMIERAYFQGFIGEMAFAELVYRKQAKGFSFQPNHDFAWGDVRKIDMRAEELISESVRRAQELPGIIGQLGGGKARYQKVVQEFSAASFEQNIQWLINSLWHTIDGYIMVDQLSQRVGADTYTVMQGLRELINRGVVSLINRSTPFAATKQLGTPIISHTDFDINPGDSLKAFYLDPLSGAARWQDGNFAGVASVLQPKNLLHSIPIYLNVPGALILKNYKLIGVHNGPIQMSSGQSAGDKQLSQMMWIGALFDMGTKKLRAGIEGIDEKQAVSGTKLANLRERRDENGVSVKKPSIYLCSVCFASNTKPGNCFNCGAIIHEQEPLPIQSGFSLETWIEKTRKTIKKILDLKEKHKISNLQILVGIAVVLLLLLVILMFISSGEQPAEVSVNNKNVFDVNKNSEKAIKTAVDQAGFKSIAPPGYWYEDTSSLTTPLPSFGLYSDAGNQKIMFVIFNDLSPVLALDRFTPIPPFSDVVASNSALSAAAEITKGSQLTANGNLRYFVYNYPATVNENQTTKIMLIGSLPAKDHTKGMLVLGQALREGTFDYKSTLFLIDAMAELPTSGAESKTESETNKAHSQANKANTQSVPKSTEKAPSVSETGPATDEEITTYCDVMQEKLQKKSLQSSVLQEEIKKRKGSKFKIVLELDLDSGGFVKKMEISEPDAKQKVNDALVKIVESAGFTENVPVTESNALELRIVFKNGEIKVERR